MPRSNTPGGKGIPGIPGLLPGVVTAMSSKKKLKSLEEWLSDNASTDHFSTLGYILHKYPECGNPEMAGYHNGRASAFEDALAFIRGESLNA